MKLIFLRRVFWVTSKTLSDKDIIAATEDKVKDLEKKKRDRHDFCPKKKPNWNSKPSKDNLSKDEHKASENIQSDTSIVILPAGKGRSTVILNYVDYLEKCLDNINNDPY